METANMGLNARESEFFGAYMKLLSEYQDMDGRFGLWRIHKHFDINDDEVLHETSDAGNRVSTVNVIKKQDLPNHAFVSQWIVSSSGTKPGSWCCD